MMLHSDVFNGDATRHVTHGYATQNFLDHGEDIRVRGDGLGENHFGHDYNGKTKNEKTFMNGKDRHSTDVDDGVISSDGDYDASIKQNLDAFETEVDDAVTGRDGTEDKSSASRLSHADSTDSGMGFIENVKDGENSRLSANDGYGTIHLVEPPQNESENRKSLIHGDVEYDEVMEFISNQTDKPRAAATQGKHQPTLSTFRTPQKIADDGTVKACDSASKYAELDLAKILHTRRRHRNATSTLNRRAMEEEKAEEGSFNSLRRKPKSKSYSMSAYATYGRNRKSSRLQQDTDSWSSRPSSTCNEKEDVLSPLTDSHKTVLPSTSFDRQSNYSLPETPASRSHSLKTRRSDLTSDLMMTSDVADDVMGSSATIDERISWRTRPKSPPVEVENPTTDTAHDTNRWSWLSNSSQAQSHTSEKPPTLSKSPWKIFRRLLGGGDSNKQRHTIDGAMSSASLSPSRSRSTSLFRRFSTKKSNKNPLNKRRSSIPTKSEWDVSIPNENGPELSTHVPVIDAGKQRPIAPNALSQKSRGRLSARLMSFRGSKNKNSKRLSNDPMSKGLSISSPQLAINAIDPTRNYSEHQLLDLENLSINNARPR